MMQGDMAAFAKSVARRGKNNSNPLINPLIIDGKTARDDVKKVFDFPP